MLTQQQVIRRIAEAGRLKGRSLGYAGVLQALLERDSRRRKPKLPEYSLTHRLACELAEAAAIHLVKGTFPEKLFMSKAPGQKPEELEYARSNYRQVTLSIAMDYLNVIGRMFNDLSSCVTVSDAEAMEYLNTGIREFNSLNNWITSNLLLFKTMDPNGVVMIEPGLQLTTNEQGEMVISGEQNRPQPKYVATERIVYYHDDEQVIIDTTPEDERKTYTFLFIDRQAYYTARYDVQTRSVQMDLYYEHEWGFLPAQRLKGVPRFIGDEIVWQSPFHYVTDLLDAILVNYSTLQNIIFKCGYPTRVYIGRRCTYEKDYGDGVLRRCEGGIIINPELKQDVCPKCNGTGLMDRFSELHDYILMPPSGMSEGETKISFNPFMYVSPDVEIVRFLNEYIAMLEEKARRILHIHTSNSLVRGSENMTATGMAIDNKMMYSFIRPVAEQAYDTVRFLYEGILWMRYKDESISVTVRLPREFDFRSEADYIESLRQAYQAQLPPFVIHQIVERFVNNYYSHTEQAQQITRLILQTDRLIGLTEEQIGIYYAKGLIEDWEVLLHQSPLQLIDELIRTDEAFLTSPDAVSRLIELARKKAAETQLTPPPGSNLARVL
jgi:hypothetical protein